MPNPTISFRLSEFQLARGLHIIRQLEPNYQITSLSAIVKACYFDYLAKMNLSRSADIPPEITIELNNFLNSGNKELTLDDIIEMSSDYNEQTISTEKSEINSVNDFSPPEDWKDEK
jgi:hypothetical protein